jgi:cytochrome c-type biogenesis protein CcmH
MRPHPDRLSPSLMRLGHRLRVIVMGMALLLAHLPAAHALGLDAPLADAAQEARARALFHQIRCVVCQGESIADSPADIAGILRRDIREKLASGSSEDEIKAWLASHYGDAILMSPPLKASTFLLWFGPLLILALATLLAACYFRNQKRAGSV